MNQPNRRSALRPLAALALAAPLFSVRAADSSTDAARRTIVDAHDRFKAAWNRRDAAALGAMLTDDGAFTTPYSGGTLTGGAAVRQLLEVTTFAAFPDFGVQTTGLDFADSRTLYERWVITGTWSGAFKAGPMAGAPPSGRSFTVPGISRYEWDGARIRRYDAWFDQLSLLAQIGALGGPPPARG